MRAVAAVALALAFASADALAQTTTNAPASTATITQPAPAEEPNDTGWSFSASAYTYLVPDAGNYVQPTFTADRGWLHLEARYNYEDINTASAWVGYNLSGGDTLAWEFTPMLGGVFGDLTGIAPGYKGSLSWWKLELYSEGESVFDRGDSADSFFYNWSELTLAPVDWLRFGLVTQRTRAYESDRDIQRGLLVGVSYRKLDLSAYYFNPDDEQPTFVIAVGLTLGD